MKIKVLLSYTTLCLSSTLLLTGVATPAFGANPGTSGIPVFFKESPTAEALLNLAPAEIQAVTRGEKRLDAWWETYLNFGSAPQGGDICQTPHWRNGWEKLAQEMPFANDPSKNKTGDFAVVYEASRAQAGTYAVGMHSGPFLQPWKLAADWKLHLWLKGENMTTAPDLVLIDKDGKRAQGNLPSFTPDGKWHEVIVPLSSLNTEQQFDFGAVRAVQFEQQWSEATRFSMDGMRFYKDKLEIGVTDKNLTQRLDEARRTRLLRTHESIVNSPELIGESGMLKKRKQTYLSEFGLWPRKGLDLAQANVQLNKTLSRILQNKEYEEWAGIVQPTWYGLYWNFGSKSPLFPGRLSPENEELILKIIWESNIYANDIHFARFPSLWVWSSENHDGAWRLKGLLSSTILNDVPKYQSRLFPDLGIELGTPTANKTSHPIHPDAPAEYFPRTDTFGPHADGKQHSVAEHYEAWTDLWHRYLTDRSKVNFFLEEAGGYRIALIRNIYTAYLYGRDPDLTKRAGMFLDMYWLKYAQNYLAGMRGGPKRRSNLSEYDGKISPYVTFHLGGPATDHSIGYWMHPAAELLLCDYDLPRVVWKMMLDKKGLGDFVFEARGLAEENDVLPRPAGTGKIFMLDGKQRSVRYRYNTPYYLMSTLMESPNMLHTYLSPSKFSQGLMVPWKGARMMPLRSGYSYNSWGKNKENQFHSVQDKNVYAGYTTTMHQRRSPDHFPNLRRRPFSSEKNKGMNRFGGEIMIQGWDKVVEKGGWVLAKSGSAYGAARIVVPEYDDRGNPRIDPKVHNKLVLQTENCYYWNDKRTVIGNKTSDVMIIEAGSEEEYGSFENFCEAILKNRLHVWKAHHGYVMVYRGARKGAKEIVLNVQNPHVPPKLDGKPVNYELPWTVKSPFVKSHYKSGVVSAEFGGEKLLLNFNMLLRNEKQ